MPRSSTLALVLALAFAAPAAANTFTVTTTRDATDAAIDGTCAITGGGCSLRAAFQEANATTAEDQIVLPAGDFRIMIPGVDEDDAATGDFDSKHALAVTGAGANRTVIDGNGADRVLEEVGGDLTLTAVTVTGGALAADGAGIAQTAGNLIVRDSAVVDNTGLSNPSGGGIYAGGITALIERSLLARNHAYNGGALDGSATITVRASTIANNTAGTLNDNGDGGAADTDATYIDSTIVGNIAFNGSGAGGGINGGTLRNTVMADNVSFNQSAPTDPAVPDNCGGTVTSQGNNVSSDDTCAFAGPGDRNSLDPQLSVLGDHGGTFASFAPLPGSPLIDSGAQCDALDMRGGARPSGAACDVGAIETAPPAIAGATGTAAGQSAGFVSGAIDAALAPATAHVEYGTTTAYGAATADLAAGGPFAAVLSGLQAGTTYHARIVATSAYGTATGPDVTFTTAAAPIARDTKAPKLGGLKIATKLRGKVTFSLTEKAVVRLLFIGANGHRKATLTVHGHSGRNSAKLPKALRVGRYAVAAWATDTAGNRSSPSLRTIRLRKR